MGYDVIGDIHGHAAKLEALLRKLGYAERRGSWVPPAGRQAVFLGDLIDRGPEQMRVVDIVRRMVDAGHALCVMGNHEFNAIGYATPRADGSGAFLRTHSPGKVAQHAHFLAQVGEGSDLHRELVEWFRTLPPVLDLGGIRVVHAWWHQPHVDLVAAHYAGRDRMGDDVLHAAHDKESPLWAAMEGLTKGQEITLPDGHEYEDHAGQKRREIRTKWWHGEARSFKDTAIVPDGQLHAIPDHPLPDHCVHADPEGAPVFVGHYWFKGQPTLQTAKVACLDWSAAGDGPLVAYSWNGENELDADNFVMSHTPGRPASPIC